MTIVKTGWTAVKGLWNNESGQGMAEYGLILALVSIVAIFALGDLGTEIKAVFNEVVSSMQSRSF